MKVYHSSQHALHAPVHELKSGELSPPHECPRRMDVLLDAVRELGVEATEPRDHGPEPIRAVHAPSYLAFLERAVG